MIDFPTPIVLEKFWYNSYNLKQHLKEFLHLDSETLDSKLETGFKQLAELGKKDFDWESVGFKNEEQQLIAFNWRNTMPLSREENLKKHNN